MLNRIFRLHKNGELVNVKFKGLDAFRKPEIFEPLAADRVIGIDTESLTVAGRLKTVLVPMHYSTGDELIEGADGNSLGLVLRSITERYSMPENRESRTKQREYRDREDGRRRDGRREIIDPVLLVFFNLPYDIGRLCAGHTVMLRALGSGADTYRVFIGSYEVEVSRMILGAGASFEWYVRGNGRITRLIGIDMVGYWKCSLAKAAKAVGVTEKIEIDSGLYSKPFEQFTDQEWEIFKRYSLGDVQTTSELYHATVALLRTIDARVVRRNGIIPPSAPGAATRIAFAKAFNAHPIDSWKRYPAWADQMGCDSYYGGRAFCVRPGVYNGVSVLDLKSAYPFAMTLLPDPVTINCRIAPPAKFTETILNSLRGKFGVMYADGESLDPIYPPFRVHDTVNKRLRYVYGSFENLPMTIPELVIGIESGSLEITKIRKGTIMEGSSETSFLRIAMQDFFAIKENPANTKALQAMAKLLANSTYGKLIEVQHTQHYLDSDVMCPPFEDMYLAAEELARLYAETSESEFDEAASLLIERCAKHKIDCHDLTCKRCGPEKVEPGPAVPIRRRMSAFKRYQCGQYFMPLYAAQVTGLISAMLGLMARSTKALQGDTDSVHVKGIPQTGAYYDTMQRAGYPSPLTGIGSWAHETIEPSVESVCVRPKMYSHLFADGSYKQAKHSFSKYPNGNAELHEAMKRLLDGNTVVYDTKPSPRKLRDALIHGKEIGEFIRRQIRVMVVLDPNIKQVDGINYWTPIRGSQ